MKKELQNRLFDKYPNLFVQKDLDPTQTLMCYGLNCGDGWFNIVDNLCKLIQKELDAKQIDNVEIVQVKEKFGTLRVYLNNYNDRIRGLVSFAEAMSGCICETCGLPGKPTTSGWIKTMCSKCESERYKLQENK